MFYVYWKSLFTDACGRIGPTASMARLKTKTESDNDSVVARTAGRGGTISLLRGFVGVKGLGAGQYRPSLPCQASKWSKWQSSSIVPTPVSADSQNSTETEVCGPSRRLYCRLRRAVHPSDYPTRNCSIQRI